MRLPRSFKIFLPICLFGFVIFTTIQMPSYAEDSLNYPTNIFYKGRPSLTHFTSAEGLPVNAVMSMERDNRGFIWFGTQDGVAVFNGYDFSIIDMPNRAASNYVYEVLAAKDGSIWFATSNGGLHRLKDDKWKTFDKSSGLAGDEIRTLYESFSEDGKRIMWIGRRNGLSRLIGDKVENFDIKDGLPSKRISSIVETIDKNGGKTLWIGTHKGIAVWRDGEKKIYDDKNGLPDKIVYALTKTQNEKGENVIWAGTKKGITKFENGEWQTFEDVSEMMTKSVRGLEKTVKLDGTQTVWVGFDGEGVAYLENGKWRFLKQKDGLPNETIFGFAPTGAGDGSVWISTLGQGVSRFERSNWRSINKDNGLPNDIVFAMAESVTESGEKELWFGTYGGGLARFTNGEFKVFDKDSVFKNDYVQDIFASKDENGKPIVYFGLETGLKSYQNGVWEDIKLLDDEVAEVWGINESTDESGNKKLLLSTNRGFIIKGKNETKVLSKSAGLTDTNIRASLETTSKDGEKFLWIATYNSGLAKFKGDKLLAVYDKNNELLTNRTYSVNEIKFGDSRQLWVGTGGGGIAVLDLDDENAKFQNITTENSKLIPSDKVYQIFQDSQKKIYATTNKGVARIIPSDGGNILGFNSYFFTTKDGLPNNECTSAAGFIDSQNRVWVGTVSGASVLDLEREFKDETAEPLFLQSVLIDGEKRNLLPNAQLSYDENNLTFEYAMPTNFRESATLYQTQMIGLEDKPTEWTKEPRREFTFIPSGDFVFKVWGKDASGNISKPLEIPFSISRPWWMTWWAILLYFLATAAIVSFIAYLISRNRFRRMLEIERVRTRIATDLHDDVGASLSKISILSEVLAQSRNGANEEDKDALQSIADTSREVVSSMSDMVWSINPNRDNMRDTVQRMRRFANEVLSAKDIDFTFDTPKGEREIKLDVDLRRQIYLVFKESLNNCAKYSECTKVEIELQRKAEGIFLRISDNGKGFEMIGLNRGNGLRNMKARAEEINGTFDISSEIGEGTTVTLKLPRRLGGLAFPKTT